MIALEPGGAAAYAWLASALVARGASIESISDALRQAAEHETDATLKEFDGIENEIVLAWLTGDFAGLVASFPRFDAFAAKATSDGIVGTIANDEMITLDESGQTERALAVGEAYLRRRPALTLDGAPGGRAVAFTLARRSGRLADAGFRAEREACGREERAKAGPKMGNVAWFRCWAQPSATPADAREALDVFAQLSPSPAYEGIVYNERVMGHALRLAGRDDEAVPHLVRAVSACFNPLYVPSHEYAAEMLGEALAGEGDTARACAAFDEVLVHWGKARPRSVTADAARAHIRRLGCGR
jgi:serine/threonine-protein kinase